MNHDKQKILMTEKVRYIESSRLSPVVAVAAPPDSLNIKGVNLNDLSLVWLNLKAFLKNVEWM